MSNLDLYKHYILKKPIYLFNGVTNHAFILDDDSVEIDHEKDIVRFKGVFNSLNLWKNYMYDSPQNVNKYVFN